MIVLDPGHGGIDPGHGSADGVTEKEVVLAFAKTLRAKARGDGGLSGLPDARGRYLPRAPRARRVRAEEGREPVRLDPRRFVSPSTPTEASGATVYTLSEQASDDEAKELATKENFSDAIAGVELPSDRDEVVANILIDLAQRETQNRSIVFATLDRGRDDRVGIAHEKSSKSAGFRVLKSPDVPSVLLELGFLSNPDDEKRLDLRDWRDGHGGEGRRGDRQLFRQAHGAHAVLSAVAVSASCCTTSKNQDDFPRETAFCCHNLG